MSEQKEYIEKDAAIAAANILNIYRAITPEDAVAVVVRRINNTPPAEVKPVVRGAWIENGCITECSECGEPKRFPHWTVCPNCGADMRKEAKYEP